MHCLSRGSKTSLSILKIGTQTKLSILVILCAIMQHAREDMDSILCLLKVLQERSLHTMKAKIDIRVVQINVTEARSYWWRNFTINSTRCADYAGISFLGLVPDASINYSALNTGRHATLVLWKSIWQCSSQFKSTGKMT